MKAIFKSKTYWLIVSFSTVIIFLASLNLGKIYRSETEIIIYPKNEFAKSNILQISENAIGISKTISFYEKVAKEIPESFPLASEKSTLEIKKIWNSKMEAAMVNSNGVIVLSAYDANKASSEKISRKSALVLAQEISKFYDIKTSIDLRVVAGTKTEITNNYTHLQKIIGSFMLSMIVVFFSFSLSKIITDEKNKNQKAKDNSIIKKLNKKLEKRCSINTPEQAKQKLNYLLKEIIF